MSDNVDMQVQCRDEGCDQSFQTSRGMESHYTRAHKAKQADELFTVVAKATEVLFPGGIPYDRVIEIADLQREMLKVLTR